MNNDIEITTDEADIFLEIVGNFSSSWELVDEDIRENFFCTEGQYNEIMTMYDRIYQERQK